jgi:hypothetical protein
VAEAEGSEVKRVTKIPKVVPARTLVDALGDVEYALLEIARALSDRNKIEQERNDQTFPKQPEPKDAEIFDPEEERQKTEPVAGRFARLLKEAKEAR